MEPPSRESRPRSWDSTFEGSGCNGCATVRGRRRLTPGCEATYLRTLRFTRAADRGRIVRTARHAVGFPAKNQLDARGEKGHELLETRHRPLAAEQRQHFEQPGARRPTGHCHACGVDEDARLDALLSCNGTHGGFHM
jgi:hypothetical protein